MKKEIETGQHRNTSTQLTHISKISEKKIKQTVLAVTDQNSIGFYSFLFLPSHRNKIFYTYKYILPKTSEFELSTFHIKRSLSFRVVYTLY